MHTFRITMLADAYALVARYQLDRLLEARAAGTTATAGDLARFLHFQADNVEPYTPQTIAFAVADYIDECTQAKRNGTASAKSMSLLAETLSVEDTLKEVDRDRQKFVDLIRDIKFDAHGPETWSALAYMATVAAPSYADLDGPHIAGLIEDALDRIAEFNDEFDGALSQFYRPGEDEVHDTLVRLDIERLDQLLRAAPPWDGQEPDLFIEVGALHRLAANTSLRAELAQANPRGIFPKRLQTRYAARQ